MPLTCRGWSCGGNTMNRRVAAANTMATKAMTPRIREQPPTPVAALGGGLWSSARAGSSEISSDNSGAAVLEGRSIACTRSVANGTQSVISTTLLGTAHGARTNTSRYLSTQDHRSQGRIRAAESGRTARIGGSCHVAVHTWPRDQQASARVPPWRLRWRLATLDFCRRSAASR